MADAEAGVNKSSDLGVRLISALVMLAVTGLALWFGGAVLDAFLVVVAIATLIELVSLVTKATGNGLYRVLAIVGGAIYVGVAAVGLARFDVAELVLVLGVVVATDVGAYFTGRAIGGPKIAPSISPSKTWAGLVGGMLLAAGWLAIGIYVVATLAESARPTSHVLPFAIGGAFLAIAAQAGDFLESWLKRKAGVKDSSQLIPGHGGVFDRTDGMIPVAILATIAMSFAP